MQLHVTVHNSLSNTFIEFLKIKTWKMDTICKKKLRILQKPARALTKRIEMRDMFSFV